MKVNGIDIRKYNAKQLTVDLQPPKLALNTEWVEHAPVPQEFETDIQYGTLKVTILFRGSSRNDIQRKMSSFLLLFTSRCELNLDGYKGTYIGDIASSSNEKTKVADRYILTLQFNGYMVDDEIVNTYKGCTAAKFETVGTRDAPCIVEILPQVDMTEYTVGGFGDDDIILKNLKKAKKIVIDGYTGIVTEDGANKFAECDMWEFPKLRKGTENSITFSNAHCDVTVRYKPMYL